MIRGFCGITLGDDEIAIAPRLPRHWNRVVVPYQVGKNAYEITIEKERVAVEVRRQSGPHPRFTFRGAPVAITSSTA